MFLLLAFTDGPSPQEFVAEGGSTDLCATFSVCPSAPEIYVLAFYYYLEMNMHEKHAAYAYDKMAHYDGNATTGYVITVNMTNIKKNVAVYIMISFNDSSSNEIVEIKSNMSYIYVRGKKYPLILLM